jgi:hypothetical protein
MLLQCPLIPGALGEIEDYSSLYGAGDLTPSAGLLFKIEEELFKSELVAFALDTTKWALLRNAIDLDVRSLILRCTYNGLDCLDQR